MTRASVAARLGMLAALGSASLLAQEGTLPPGAKTKILPLVYRIEPLQLKVSPLEQAMKDLGAKIVGDEIRIDLPADVLFDFDKSDIRHDAAAALTKAVLVINSQPSGRVRIEGHTDSDGTDQYNERLSDRRAASVKKWLGEHGVQTSRMTTRGFGESKPLVENDTPENRQRNRRVEIRIERRTGRG